MHHTCTDFVFFFTFWVLKKPASRLEFLNFSTFSQKNSRIVIIFEIIRNIFKNHSPNLTFLINWQISKMIYRSVSEIFKSHFSWRKKLRYLAAEVKQMGRKRSRPPKRRKAKNRLRNRGYAITEMAELSDSVFKLMFRIDRPSFEYLASRLKNSLDRNELLATNSSGSPVTVTTRLAVTLRWLAGGSYLDI